MNRTKVSIPDLIKSAIDKQIKKNKMQSYIKTYMKHFNLGEEDTILCEVSGRVAVDIHHIHIKGMGGCKTFTWKDKTYPIDDITNLIALSRDDHKKAHSNEHDKGFLMLAHKYKMSGQPFQHRKR